MLTALIVIIVIVLFFAVFVFYKRNMIGKMFSLHLVDDRSQFQQELEQTADRAIMRLEEQMMQLELLLGEADAKLKLLDQRIQDAEALERQFAEGSAAIKAESGNKAFDVKIAAHPDELAMISPAGHMQQTRLATETSNMDKRKLVAAMADQGYNVTEIAKATGLGKGEIMLLQQLHKR